MKLLYSTQGLFIMKALPVCLGKRHIDQLFCVFIQQCYYLCYCAGQIYNYEYSKTAQNTQLLPKYLDLQRLHIMYTQ